MQYTSNYNLNIVEGTDIVNPMSVDNPNYQTIDATMYANECNAIGSATELKSGTVHALTRVKANQNVFRFRATARYVAGDTFTVDGTVVTAQLPDGSALADGSYIIGSDVLCALVGTQLTLFVSINNGTQIMYDNNTSVNQKIDSLDASNLEYSTGVSIKSKIDDVETTADKAMLKALEYSGTTTSSGALLLPTTARANYVANIIYDPLYTERGLVYQRGDGYCTCFNNSLQVIAETEVHIIIYYIERT